MISGYQSAIIPGPPPRETTSCRPRPVPDCCWARRVPDLGIRAQRRFHVPHHRRCAEVWVLITIGLANYCIHGPVELGHRSSRATE